MNTSSQTTTASSFTTFTMTKIALITAITCIIAPFSIPIPMSPVPISLTNLILCISIYILGWKYATISYVIYVLLGAVGLPVFSGFTGGIGKLLGPTGGYLLGFLFLTIVAGLFVEYFPKNRILHVIGMVIGTMLCYTLGTLWLAYQLDLSLAAALAAGVIPYLFGDALKTIVAVIVGPILRARLAKI